MNQPQLAKPDAAACVPAAPRPQPAPSPAPAQACGPWTLTTGRKRFLFWLGFVAVFAFGAFLRFWHLGQQSLWCDETATLSRVSGNFTYLLNSLWGQGFPPGWYAALWAWLQFLEYTLHIAPGIAITSVYVRTLGAILGTLNVAAAYFLARQFMSRRTALFVMLLVAVNPFLIYYSRDLKMYSALYLMVTLNMAFFSAGKMADTGYGHRCIF